MLTATAKPISIIKDTSTTSLNLIFVIMILCVAILGGYAVYQANELNQQTEDIYNHPFIVSNALRDISIQILSMRSNMQDIPFASETEINKIVASMQKKETKALASFDIVLGAFLGDKKEIEQTRDLFIQWQAIRQAIVSVAKHGEREKAYADTQGFGLAHVAKLRARIRAHIEYANAKAKQFRQSSARLENTSRITSIALSILILIIACISFVFVSRRHKKHAAEIHAFIEDIKRGEDKFRGILDAAPDAVLVIDQSRVINISNTNIEKVFGYKKDDLVGKKVDVLIPEGLRHGHDTLVSNYFSKPRSRDMSEGVRLMALHKDGHAFPVTISLSPVTLDGETYVTCDIRDMTGYEILEEKFRQAQKLEAVGALVGGIAHDFNNILAAIIGAVFLAKRKPEQNKRHLICIETQAERASDMVKQLLAFARKDIRKMEPISVNDLVKQSSKLFKLTTSEHIQFNIDLCQAELSIMGDPTQLQQIILNLVNNARDALAEIATPAITISTQISSRTEKTEHPQMSISSREYACISVSDNGHGIETRFIQEIFEPFFTRKDVGKGTGLGLSMVKGTVESHGGFIEVESTVMEGATFNIYLPLTDTNANSDADVDIHIEAEILAAGNGECILLVDDEPAVREVNREILEALGYHVAEAANGIQAIAQFKKKQNHIALIIMDVVMPRMGGITAAQKIREITDSVPIIFATGYDRSQVLGEHEAELSNSTIMSKPFSVQELEQSIRSLL